MRLFFGISLAILLAFTTAATPETEGVPEDGILSFDIVRNGSSIGTHTYRFDQYDGRTEVRIKTEIDYRLLLIPIYRFEHESHEVWENGRLSLLESNTNENGTPVKLEVFRDEDLLMVMGEDGELHVDREIIPASLWNRMMLERNETLTTISGNLKRFEVTYVGQEDVKIRGTMSPAQPFRLSGEFERDLWYDANDILVRVQFEASDGSTVAYVLK